MKTRTRTDINGEKKETIKWAWTDEIEERNKMKEKKKNEIDQLGLERRS